jgi:asparagine synthase (glutamine-hydrolysing)
VLTWVSPRSAPPWVIAGRRLVLREGGRVILTGRLGDAVMGGFADYSQAIADPLSRGRLIEALKQARLWSLATKKPAIALLPRALGALLPARLRERLVVRELLAKAAKSRRADSATLQTGYCVDPTLAREVADVYPDYSSMVRDIAVPSKRSMLRGLTQSAANRRFTYADLEPHVEYSHPYLDRRLVEFVLAIPTLAWCRPGEPRSLMRRAFAGFMPDRITRRFSKGYAEPTIVRSLRPVIAEALPRVEQLEVVRRHYVDLEHLRGMLENVQRGRTGPGALVNVFSLEAWLCLRGRTRPASIAVRTHAPGGAIVQPMALQSKNAT